MDCLEKAEPQHDKRRARRRWRQWDGGNSSGVRLLVGGEGMSSRGVRRRKHKQLRRLVLTLHDRQRMAVTNQFLSNWQAEAKRRARLLGAPAVWQLTTDPHIKAIIRELDPTGNLLADLRRVCTEAIADEVDRRMIRSGRPLVARAK